VSNFEKGRSVDFLRVRSLIESEPYRDADPGWRQQVLEYIANGIEPTHPCVRAILRNDLSACIETMGLDGIASVRLLLAFLWDHAPGGCFGGETTYENWIQQRRAAVNRERLAQCLAVEEKLAEIRRTNGARR